MPFYSGTLAAESNRADLAFQVEMLDPVTNDTIDMTDCVITVALRLLGHTLPALTGTNLDGHVDIVAANTFQVHFSREEMGNFAPGEIDLGITIMLNDGITYQLFAGQLPLVDGVVAR
jgi:hypothetical protein